MMLKMKGSVFDWLHREFSSNFISEVKIKEMCL